MPAISGPVPSSKTDSRPAAVVFGWESVGKTQFLGSLTSAPAKPQNYRGSTLACEIYRHGDWQWVDTPGHYRESESETSRLALESLDRADSIVLVARAGQAATELTALLPLAAGKRGVIVLTFADQLRVGTDLEAGVRQLHEAVGVPVFAIDARHLDSRTSASIIQAVAEENGPQFPLLTPLKLPSPFVTAPKQPSWMERAASHPLIALLLLFLPAIIAVTNANRLADWLYEPLGALLQPLLHRIGTWPELAAALVGGDYGLVAMLPFLLLYALPTILAFSAILALYKSTGLIDRISVTLHPWLRPFGIGGRDLVRVVMGYGCNVPAVISSRACASCSRGACVSAISFGSACSYQLPATLAVFSAAGMSDMGFAYVILLAVTTLIYLRFTTPTSLRQASNRLLLPLADSLHPIPWQSLRREMGGTLRQFFLMALPVFVVICFVAAGLAWIGALDGLARLLRPVMMLFNLPGEAATAIVLGSIRKDGLAIGLLDSDWGALKVALETPAQVLTAVYLAGVLLPCLVTLFTIGREMRWSFAAKLAGRQMIWAAGFSLAIAWIGALIHG